MYVYLCNEIREKKKCVLTSLSLSFSICICMESSEGKKNGFISI